ncbi:MAG: hypothetical protein KAR20_15610, partial [Candidatus Heimdallarchaeota archaeon]|nr:hypothetical protein [Candidatus Heimdallarchaeota archaeon]
MRLAATEAEESFINDAMMGDEYEFIPGGGAVSYSNIRKFNNMEDFIVTSSEGEDVPVEYNRNILQGY